MCTFSEFPQFLSRFTSMRVKKSFLCLGLVPFSHFWVWLWPCCIKAFNFAMSLSTYSLFAASWSLVGERIPENLLFLSKEASSYIKKDCPKHLGQQNWLFLQHHKECNKKFATLLFFQLGNGQAFEIKRKKKKNNNSSKPEKKIVIWMMNFVYFAVRLSYPPFWQFFFFFAWLTILILLDSTFNSVFGLFQVGKSSTQRVQSEPFVGNIPLLTLSPVSRKFTFSISKSFSLYVKLDNCFS